jgi:hypothetical protein
VLSLGLGHPAAILARLPGGKWPGSVHGPDPGCALGVSAPHIQTEFKEAPKIRYFFHLEQSKNSNKLGK